MRTSEGAANALFLFAHQDDEFGVFGTIARAAAAGRVRCAYLTDGAAGGPPARRNAESLRVLARLGVAAADVHFCGGRDGIADGRLYERLPAVAAAVDALLAEAGDDARVYVPAWEGGHHDHDGLHAVTAILMRRRARLPSLRQFPLYNAFGRPGPLFRVLTPLPHNGPAEHLRLGGGERLRQLRDCLAYPSQRTTWLGLFPFVAMHLLLRGRTSLQQVDAARVRERPHPGRLYYEKRGFLGFDRLQQAIAAWADGA